VLGIANFGSVRSTLLEWSAKEKDEASAVRLIAQLHPATCKVFMNDLDIERSEAMPRVLPFVGERLSGPCTRSGTVIVGLRSPIPVHALGTTKPMRNVCAKSVVMRTTSLWQISDCRALRSRVHGQPVKNVLRANQVVPGIGPRLLRKICVRRYGPSHCGLKA
jgi:hypothetical protein